MVLDLVEIDESTGRARWWVAATVAAPAGIPELTRIALGAEEGLDLMHLQRDFRWLTPLDVVTRILPRLVREGEDPYHHDFPVSGFPEVSQLQQKQGRQLSDEFLEDIAREYLLLGRGYVHAMASTHQVSERTITSWIHKARERGILTGTRRGVKGGQWVAREDRPAHG